MLGRLVTWLRSTLREDGEADRPPRGRPDGGESTAGGHHDEPPPRYFVCDGCDTTFIARRMGACPKCGDPVERSREADYRRQRYV